MIRLVQFFVSLLALDSRGQRAMDATIADWRHELAQTKTAGQQLVIQVRSVASIARTLTNAGVAELPSAWASPFTLKLAAIVAMWVVWMLKDGPPGSTDRFFMVTSDLKASTLVAAELIPQLLIVFPLAVFLAEALGRRRRATPIAGTAVLLAALVVLLGPFLLPLSLTYSQYETWRFFANASVVEPDVTQRLLSGFTVLSTIVTVVSVLGVWLVFIFANRVRRVGGVRGWGTGLGVILLAYIAGSALLLVQFPILRIALIVNWPILSLAAVLWATSHLAGIEAARLSHAGEVNS